MLVGYLPSICVDIASSLLSALGITLQRKSHVLNDHLDSEHRKSALRRPLWHLGFWIYIICASSGSVFSISNLPITILAPLNAFSLVFQLFFAWLILHDHIDRRAIDATLIIGFGAVLVTIFGYVPQESLTSSELIPYYKNGLFISYIIICDVLLIFLLLFNQYLKFLERNYETLAEDHFIKEYDVSRLSVYIGIIYCIAASVLASQGVLFAKAAFLLLYNTMTGTNEYYTVFAWVVTILTALYGIAQLVYLNKALVYLTPIIITPIGYSVSLIFGTLNSLVYYKNNEVVWWKFILIFLGAFFIIIGVYLLSHKHLTRDESRIHSLL